MYLFCTSKQCNKTPLPKALTKQVVYIDDTTCKLYGARGEVLIACIGRNKLQKLSRGKLPRGETRHEWDAVKCQGEKYETATERSAPNL